MSSAWVPIASVFLLVLGSEGAGMVCSGILQASWLLCSRAQWWPDLRLTVGMMGRWKARASGGAGDACVEPCKAHELLASPWGSLTHCSLTDSPPTHERPGPDGGLRAGHLDYQMES